MLVTLRGRIWQSLAATTFARLVQFAYVFIMVPVLLGSWGPEFYGEWIILTAVAGLGSLPNLGIVQASASEILLAVGARDAKKASEICVTSISVVGAIVLFTLCLAWVMIHSISIKTYFAVSIIPQSDAAHILLLALASALLTAFIPPFSSALSAVVGSGVSISLGAFAKIAELFAIWAVVYFRGGPVLVSLILVLSVAANIVAHIILVRVRVPSLSFDWRHFKVSVLRRLVPSSLAQLLIYVSVNTLGVQLPRIVLGHLMGPSAVALFAVTVTYSRTIRTITSLFSQAFQVEATKAFAERQYETLTRIIRGLCQLQLWSAIALAIVLTLAGRTLFGVWTHGRIEFDFWLCVLVSLGFVAGSFADAVQFVLIGINKIMPVAIVHLTAVLISMVVAVFLNPLWGTSSMAAALIIPELAVAVVGMATIARLLSLSLPEFFLSALRWPGELIWKEAMHLARLVWPGART